METLLSLGKSIENNLNKHAFCIQNKFYTYNDLAKRISIIRKALRENTCESDKNIGLVANDDIDTYASIIAIWFEGKAYVPFGAETPMTLDSRPGIRIRDRSYFYDRELNKALSDSAIKAGTQLQQLVYLTSGSDAGMVGNVGASPKTACLGHIRKNSHGYEIAYLSVFENLYKILWEFITSWKGTK